MARLTRKQKHSILGAVLLLVLVLAVICLRQIYQANREPEPLPLSRDYDQAILSEPTATVEQAMKWARRQGAADEFVQLAPVFWAAGEATGVNPVIGYAQSFLETGGFNWQGVVDGSYHNPAGLKTTEGGGDYESSAHMRFASWEEGIRAQFEHLALYAGAEGYPLQDPVDPRHFDWLLGTGPTVGTMAASWATAGHYADTLTELIDRIENEWVKIGGTWRN